MRSLFRRSVARYNNRNLPIAVSLKCTNDQITECREHVQNNKITNLIGRKDHVGSFGHYTIALHHMIRQEVRNNEV